MSGYRVTGLDGELAQARRALAAAGVKAATPVVERPLPPDVDALLSWVVREGSTNVVRHAAARHCRIALHQAEGVVHLEVMDDGGRAAADTHPQLGAGLSGLRERVAAVGGHLDAVATPAGFRLAVEVPYLPERVGST